jgi:hypothetical protein
MKNKKKFRSEGLIRVWKFSFEVNIKLKSWKSTYPMHSEAMIKSQNQSLEIEFWSQHHVIRLKFYLSYSLKGHASAPKGV